MTMFLWLYVTGFALTMGELIRRDLVFVMRELLRYQTPEDLPDWALPLAISIVVFFYWPFLLCQIKR